ncbi:glycoside hydrolase/deacetylase [Atractiella rhizophila]|nr:glycoside hydrolase/deacetylase [Atractiella rhizophila]
MSNKSFIWPDGKRGCVTITMDNMGEAADLHRGIWPSEKPIGSHYSVAEKLPRMLDILQCHSILATYFVEGWNCEHYPDALKHVQSLGHEVAFHAYQHEVWSLLDLKTEVNNLQKSISSAGSIGIKYYGFRPPGGLITDHTLRLMREQGMTYLSPAADRPAVMEGIAILPFQWDNIDAYFYMESTKPLRVGRGDSEEPLSPAVLRERLFKRVDEIERDGGYLALLFHPFLQLDQERIQVMEDVVEYVSKKRDNIWVAQCKEVANWVLNHANEFGNDPGFDRAEWKKK